MSPTVNGTARTTSIELHRGSRSKLSRLRMKGKLWQKLCAKLGRGSVGEECQSNTVQGTNRSHIHHHHHSHSGSHRAPHARTPALQQLSHQPVAMPSRSPDPVAARAHRNQPMAMPCVAPHLARHEPLRPSEPAHGQALPRSALTKHQPSAIMRAPQSSQRTQQLPDAAIPTHASHLIAPPQPCAS